MQSSTLSRLRPVLVGGLALVAVASASVTYAAPIEQTQPSAGGTVSIDSFAFAPAEISLPVGATLTWSNVQNGVPHTSTSVDGVWDSGTLSTNDTFNFTFNQVGDFGYQCDIHPSMHGIVHVVNDAGTADGSQAITDTSAQTAAVQTPAAAASTQSASAPTTQQPTTAALSAPTPAPTVVAPAVAPTPAPARYYGY
jgi:plastocyanin